MEIYLEINREVSNSDRSAKCDGTRPRSGVFYEPNAQQSDAKRTMITGEEFVDLERFFYADNSDERTTATSQQAAVLAEPIANNNKKGVSAIVADDFDLYNNNSTTNPFISQNNPKSNSDDYVADNSPIRSDYTSACTSPTNVVSMPGSPYNDYFLLSGEEIMPERVIGGNFFESLDTFIKDEEERLPPIYTPDNSNGALSSFTEFPENIKYNNVNNNNNVVINDNIDKRSQHPALTLNLRDTFFMNDEISTPNIIDSIIEASEHPVQFIREKEEIFNKSPFFMNTSLHELTPCPSASPPPISDTMDSFLTTITSSSPPVVEVARKRGRPRKKRVISDEIPEDDEDGDETYTPSSSHYARRKPPRVSRAVAKKRVIYEDISEDEDYKPPRKILVGESPSSSNCSNEEVERRLAGVYDDSTDIIRVGKRGRPPKHARSISSDDYSLLDPEEAKYREMRDRNNEASRKSRFKRKLKEVRITDQCEDLEMENIKLRAQVDELQKTVERYRDNLMKVMLSKK